MLIGRTRKANEHRMASMVVNTRRYERPLPVHMAETDIKRIWQSAVSADITI